MVVQVGRVLGQYIDVYRQRSMVNIASAANSVTVIITIIKSVLTF
jgi:hypothetical protein